MSCVVADESPNVVTQSPSQPGRCLSLNGVDQIVQAETGSVVAYPFTLMGFVKFDEGVGANKYLFSVSVSGASDKYIAVLSSGSTGTVYTQRRNGSSVDSTPAPTGNLRDGNWHHVAVAFISSTELAVFVDGHEVQRLNGLPSFAIPASCSMAIIGSARNVSITAVPDAQLFDVRLYSREVTAAEIVNIFNTSRPGGRPQDALYPANLVGHWKLDDVDRRLKRDSSGNDYHGTVVASTKANNYSGADVPFSWQNEAGYSYTSASILGTHESATAYNGSLTSLGNNRYTLSATAAGCFVRFIYDHTAFAGKTIKFRVHIESITGGPTQASVDFADDDVTTVSAGQTAEKQFVVGNQPFDETYNFQDIAIINSVNASAMTFRIEELLVEDYIPANSSNLTQDIFGNALTYPGPLARQASLKDSNCGTFDGVDDLGTITNTHDFSATDWTFSCEGILTGTLADSRCIIRQEDGTGTGRLWLRANITTGQWQTYIGGVVVTFESIPPVVPNTVLSISLEKVGTSFTLNVNGASQTKTMTMEAANGNFFIGQLGGNTQRWTGQLWNVKLDHSNGFEIPFSEGDGDISYDVSGNGKHATISGHSRATFWGTKQSVYHRNIKKGHRIANATGAGRTFNGVDQYFEMPSNANLSMSGDFFLAAEVTVGNDVLTQYILSKWNNAPSREYALYMGFTGSEVIAGIIVSSDGTATTLNGENNVALTVGQRVFLFGFYSDTNNQLGIVTDDNAIDITAYASGVFAGASPVRIGRRSDSATNDFNGTVHKAIIGRPTGTPDWTAIRDAIYNGGTPLTFEQLTDEQKSQWGVELWCDCDEFEPVMRDKASGYVLQGNNVPRIPLLNNGTTGADGNEATNPAGAWHNGAETKIDFTGGVAAPFVDKMFLGYAGLGGTLAGPICTQGVQGKVTDKMSVYCKFRNIDPTGGNLAIFSADNGAGGSFATLLLRTGWDVSLFDGNHKAVNVGGVSAIDDGDWHDLLLVWHGTKGLVYLDSVFVDEVVMVDLATYAPNWSRARILSNANGTVNRFVGDIARIVVQAQASIPSTQFAGTPLLDVRFDHGRIADIGGNMPVVVSGSGLSFVKTTVPTAYEYRGSLPTGMSRSRTGYRESRFSLYDTDV